MANKMADKKKNARQDSTVAPKPKVRSVEQEQSKSVKTVVRAERKEQERKPVRSESKKSSSAKSKGPASWQVRLRSNRTIRFLLDAYYELRYKVTWPSFIEARNMTVVVIVLSVVIGGLLALADFGLLHLFELITGR